MTRQPAKPPAAKDDIFDPLAEEVARRIKAIVPATQSAQLVAQIVSIIKEESFSGPLPHPKHFKEYNDAVPGAGDRMLSMVEQSLIHQQNIQKFMLESDVSDMKEGRRLGFGALVLLIISAVVCAIYDKENMALVLLGTGAIGTIGTLIKGRGNNK